jgi:hypothetical protein
MSRKGAVGRVTDSPAIHDRTGGTRSMTGTRMPGRGWIRARLSDTSHQAIHDSSVEAAAKPVEREVWLACPHCGQVSRRASHRNEDGSCKSEARCLANQRENERIEEQEESVMTALNGPTTKPMDTPSLKIALLRLLRDEAKPEGAYGHTAVDNGGGRCTICGRPGAFYGIANQPNSVKTFQHKRGWAGRAKRSKVNLTPVDMAKRLGSDPHNVMHLLYSLKNAGLVSFRENKIGTEKSLENIRLTTLGLSPTRKQGSVEERIKQAEAKIGMFQPAADHEPSDDTEIAHDVAVDGVINKVHDWVFDEADVHAGAIHIEPVVEPESHVEPDGETPEPEPDHLPTVLLVNGSRFPLLVDLLSREGKRHDAMEAAVLLERAGLIDLGAQVVTAIPDNTELEQEVIDYLAEIGVRP